MQKNRKATFSEQMATEILKDMEIQHKASEKYGFDPKYILKGDEFRLVLKVLNAIVGMFLLCSVSAQNYGTIGQPGGTGGGSLDSIVYESDILADTVSLSVGGTFYDICSVSLDAGTWLITSQCHGGSDAAAAIYWFYTQITDKTSVFSWGKNIYTVSDYQAWTQHLSAIITVASTTTIYLQASTQTATGDPFVSEGSNGVGTQINAIKLSN